MKSSWKYVHMIYPGFMIHMVFIIKILNGKRILFLDSVRGAKRVNTMVCVNHDMKSPLAF